MTEVLVERVRRFNRTVTQRLGVLDDAYLSMSRPLSQARLLWEIGTRPVSVRELRNRLDLDSGYLSRLLRALEADGVVEVGADTGDARVRTVALTEAGRAEWAELDKRSQDFAGDILRPLNDGQRDRLVTAMAEVERLLLASMVEVAVTDPRLPRAQHCLSSYYADLDARLADGFDPVRTAKTGVAELSLPAGLFLVASLHGEPVGCGALRLHGEVAEIKRMWVSAEVRGLGLGRRLIAELEAHARRHGASRVRLDTNREFTEAIALYRSLGFTEVPAFNAEPYAHHWFAKDL